MLESQLRGELQTVTSGSTYTVSGSLTPRIWVVVNPASVLASLTLTMPATAQDRQEVDFSFGGSVAGGAAVVTTLSIAANSGQTMMDASAPTTANGGQTFKYRYNAALTKWYRIS